MNKIKQAIVIYLRGSDSAKKDEDDEEGDAEKKKLKDQLSSKAYLFLSHPLMGVVC